MASQVHALFLTAVFGFACFNAADGFRMARRGKANMCPGHVLMNTKGDCVDAVTQELAEGCCKECVEKVQHAKVLYDKQIATYMGICKLTPGDVSSTGNHIVNPDKICSQECQSMSMEEALLDFEFMEVEEACSTMPQELVPIEPVAKLLESFQIAWMECRKAPETTTAEPETTTMELSTTLPAMQFRPVQIVGPYDWRLVRDSSSLSAGIGFEKNELSISVVPPGIPMEQIGGWQYAATGHDVVLNIKHAVFGGQAVRLEVQAEMQYYGSYQGAGQFLKDVKFNVIKSKVDPMHWVKAHVKAVEPMSHGSSTNPLASVSLILEIEAAGTIIFKVQSWKRTMKYTFWGNGAIQSYFL